MKTAPSIFHTCGGYAMTVAVMLHVVPAFAQQSSGAIASCTARNVITASVKAVIDGRTFTLADGREIRLSAIEAAGGAAQPALSALVTGREIILSPLVPAKDRYGRLNMRAFIASDSTQQSVEAALISQGVAFAAPRGDDDACMALLFNAERTARASKLGLWSEAARRARQAEDPVALAAWQGKFAVIEGKVVSVRESGGTIYVNFGRRWSEDFTVTILKRNARKFADAGIEPKRLESRNVRVRGWIEERGGPWIEAAMPEQIEITEAE